MLYYFKSMKQAMLSEDMKHTILSRAGSFYLFLAETIGSSPRVTDIAAKVVCTMRRRVLSL
jgi:hypothetical protein